MEVTNAGKAAKSFDVLYVSSIIDTYGRAFDAVRPVAGFDDLD
jgi:hypothetical protein